MRYTGKILGVLLVFVSFSLGACGGPSTDSETHWHNQDPDGDGPLADADGDGDGDAGDGDAGDGDGGGGDGGDGDWSGGGDADGDGEPPPLGIVPSPGQLTFDDVALGSEETQTVDVTNTSDEVVAINDVVVSEGFSLSELPDEIEPGAIHQLEVTFGPTLAEQYVGYVQIHWEGLEQEVTSIQLSGNPRCVDASPLELQFLDVDIGETVIQSVTLNNCSSVTEITAEVWIEHRANMTEDVFFLVDPTTYPVDLEPGATVEVEIEYISTSLNTVTGTLFVETDPLDRVQQVWLHGGRSGTTGPGGDGAPGDSDSDDSGDADD